MSPLRAALASGGLLCAAGFGVMETLSHIFPAAEGVLKLHDYLSATWGDAILLPVSLASLTYAYRMIPPTSHDRAWVLAGAACGAVGGLITQVRWLLDDDPQLNWTIPAPHIFYGAGIYHAVFLTASAATFAGLWMGVSRRWAYSTTVASRRAAAAIAVAFLGGMAFIVLLILDNQRTADRPLKTSTVRLMSWRTPIQPPPATWRG
jgi:hypothetical protein